MPLSENEQRLLEQMERALYAEDPKFATSLRGKDPRSNFRRRMVLCALGVTVGVVLLVWGLFVHILVSVLGFVLMLASTFFAVTGYRAVTTAGALGVVDGNGVRRPAPRPGNGRRSAGRPARAGFMERMEERWNRRRDENGR